MRVNMHKPRDHHDRFITITLTEGEAERLMIEGAGDDALPPMQQRIYEAAGNFVRRPNDDELRRMQPR